jgi:hypothetical protein
MIKMITASTREIDDPEIAVQEILAGLNIEKTALSHSVGIMIPVLEYLESIGLAANGKIDEGGLGSIPLVLTLEDGSQVVRSPRTMTGDGALICYGDAPAGSTIDFAYGDKDYVIQSARETVADALTAHNARNMMIFSCAARRWTLGGDVNAEMSEVAGQAGDACKYQFAYSGGEICPVARPDGKLVNRFHNYSLIACLI